jgi:hypothetical protein
MFLQNKTRRMKIYVLPHDEVCNQECYCAQGKHLQTVHDPRTGERGVREIGLSVPMSVHIPAGGVSEELSSAVLECKQIAADVAAGSLVVVKGN